MADFQKQHSLYGRILAISSSGGLVSAVSSTGAKGSTAFDLFYEPMGKAVFENVSGATGSISNSGISIVTTDSTSGSSMSVAAPAQGFKKEVFFQTSATALVLHTTATTIKFNSTLAEAAAGGSTTLTIAGGAAGIGGSLILRGLSTTAWQIVSATVSVST